jgi:endonuclease/exonuclease/phosphatase family metal-dependent hydrolase
LRCGAVPPEADPDRLASHGAWRRVNVFFWIVAFLHGLTCASAVAESLRLVTFNMLHGGITLRRTDGERLEERLAMTIDGLRALDADVIALQEASAGPGRGDVAARIAAALGYDHVRAPAGYRWIGRLAAWATGFDEGPALLTRIPILATDTIDLAACGEWYGRAAACAVLLAPNGPIRVCSTHISGNACQLDDLGKTLAARRAERPLVVMGDLNSTSDSPALRSLVDRLGLVDAFRAANRDAPGFTVYQPVREPVRVARRRVDYVLVASGARPPRVRSSRVVLDTPGRGGDGRPLWPSDHYGVVAEVELFGN